MVRARPIGFTTAEFTNINSYGQDAAVRTSPPNEIALALAICGDSRAKMGVGADEGFWPSLANHLKNSKIIYLFNVFLSVKIKKTMLNLI